MIKNDYIVELDLEFDYHKLKKVITNAKENKLKGLRSPGLKDHQYLVNEFEYMKSIHPQYPFLCSVFNIYDLPPGRGMPIHLDAGRDCTINIPITGTENTWTVFYKFIDSVDNASLEYSDKSVWNTIKPEEVEEVFRFTLTRPTLVNTGSAPHKVENNSAVKRIIISWSVLPEFTFQDVKQLLGY